MARLRLEFLERVEAYCDRIADVAEALETQGRSRRLVDQLLAAGTSVGANLFEADEAMTRADFVKCLCIAVKEINETRFWLRFIARRGWVKQERLSDLETEGVQLKKVLGTMIARSKQAARDRI